MDGSLSQLGHLYKSMCQENASYGSQVHQSLLKIIQDWFGLSMWSMRSVNLVNTYVNRTYAPLPDPRA